VQYEAKKTGRSAALASRTRMTQRLRVPAR